MRWGALAVLTCGLLTSSPLWADDSPKLNITGLEPPMDPQGTMSLEPTTTPGHGNFGAGAWASYAYRLSRIEDGRGHEIGIPIRHQVASYLLVNWGLGDRFALGLALPFVAYQQGSTIPNVDWRPSQTALGDPTFELKRNILQKSTLGGVGLAAFTRLTLPLGSDSSGIGERAIAGQLGMRGELDLVLLALRAQVGYTMRARKTEWLGETFGDYVPWAIGITLKPQALGWDKKGNWSWFLEGHGALATTPSLGTKYASPAMLSLGTRYTIASDLSLLASITLPLDSAVGVPALRATVGLSWAPRFLDADLDGIADDADDCPEGMPEDRDGFQDDDGCPDDDNDADGVPDTQDRCPSALEDLDEHEDGDGCPDLDNDRDGIVDSDDACPNVKGAPSKSKKYNGCIVGDSDQDAVPDDVDRCPDRPEDLDGRHDQDGCPDPDDDADGVLDLTDDCPTVRGRPSSIEGLNGCPDPDPDGDTYFGTTGDRFAATGLFAPETHAVGVARDLCPHEAEDFDGDRDDDGCFDPPDPKKKTTALVALQMSGTEGTVKFAHAPHWATVSSEMLSANDEVLLRALAKELRIHRDWTAQVAVPATRLKEADQLLAKKRAERLVRQLRRLTLRDNSAQAIELTASAHKDPAPQAQVVIRLRSQAARTPLVTPEPPSDSSEGSPNGPSPKVVP